jgi:type IV pilus biogenesis protein CpaD/CtpE
LKSTELLDNPERSVLVRRAHLTTALLVAASLVLAGCGGDDKSSADAAPASQEVAASTEVSTTWPMTGLPVTGDEDAAQTHPVLVTKMDNTYSSSPQIGLGEADMVVEELVEGGLTRLAAFYYSQIPDKVGPVRSMRASDIGIVSPVDATVVTSGAAARTIARIKDAGISFYQEGDTGFERDSSRSAPYNLFANLSEVAADAETDATRPDDYLPWGDEKDMPGGQAAKTIAASFGGGHTTNWTYDGKGYVNENTYAASGDEFPADTVLVLRVQVGDAGYLDPAGNPVPETKLTGKGDAMIFHGGRLVRGTWSKADLGSPLELSTKAGKLTVPAGHTWIELVPAANGDVTFAAK